MLARYGDFDQPLFQIVPRIKLSPRSVNESNDCGLTPLQSAAREGRSDIVLWLLNAGADVDFIPELKQDNPRYSSDAKQKPINLAVKYGHTYIAEILLVCGADNDSEKIPLNENVLAAVLIWQLQNFDSKLGLHLFNKTLPLIEELSKKSARPSVNEVRIDILSETKEVKESKPQFPSKIREIIYGVIEHAAKLANIEVLQKLLEITQGEYRKDVEFFSAGFWGVVLNCQALTEIGITCNEDVFLTLAQLRENQWNEKYRAMRDNYSEEYSNLKDEFFKRLPGLASKQRKFNYSETALIYETARDIRKAHEVEMFKEKSSALSEALVFAYERNDFSTLESILISIKDPAPILKILLAQNHNRLIQYWMISQDLNLLNLAVNLTNMKQAFIENQWSKEGLFHAMISRGLQSQPMDLGMVKVMASFNFPPDEISLALLDGIKDRFGVRCALVDNQLIPVDNAPTESSLHFKFKAFFKRFGVNIQSPDAVYNLWGLDTLENIFEYLNENDFKEIEKWMDLFAWDNFHPTPALEIDLLADEETDLTRKQILLNKFIEQADREIRQKCYCANIRINNSCYRFFVTKFTPLMFLALTASLLGRVYGDEDKAIIPLCVFSILSIISLLIIYCGTSLIVTGDKRFDYVPLKDFSSVLKDIANSLLTEYKHSDRDQYFRASLNSIITGIHHEKRRVDKRIILIDNRLKQLKANHSNKQESKIDISNVENEQENLSLTESNVKSFKHKRVALLSIFSQPAKAVPESLISPPYRLMKSTSFP